FFAFLLSDAFALRSCILAAVGEGRTGGCDGTDEPVRGGFGACGEGLGGAVRDGAGGIYRCAWVAGGGAGICAWAGVRRGSGFAQPRVCVSSRGGIVGNGQVETDRFGDSAVF